MPPTILIVDDHAINRKFLSLLLRYAGYRVLEAADGVQALDTIRRDRPVLVISDILMPAMDGIEFANRLHAEPAIAHIPLIFYTATYRLQEARTLAQTCGVTTVLAKPAESQHILDAVAAALGNGAAVMRDPRFSGKEPAPYLPELAGLQQRLQTALHGGDPAIDMGRTHPSPAQPGHVSGQVQALSLRMAALLELGVSLSLERHPQQLLDLFCRAAQDIMSAQYVAVGMYSNGQPRRFAYRGMTAQEVDAIFNLLDPRTGVLHPALMAGKPLGMQDVDNAPGMQELAPSHPLRRRFLIVPIKFGPQPHGWLYLANKLGADGFHEEDQQFAMTLAVQLAPFYENLVLYDEVQAHASQLQESETRFRQLTENLNEVFFLTDPINSQMLYISPSYEAIWGRSCDSLYAQPQSWQESIHPDDLDMVRKGNEERDKTGSFDYTYRIVRPDTSMRWIRARGFPIRNHAEEIYRVAGIAEDITDQVYLQQALQEREAGLRHAQRMTKSAHVITGLDGVFESWSATLPQLIGINDDDMPPSTRAWLDIVHPDDRARFRACCIEADKKSTRMDIEYRVRRGDGAWIQLQQGLEPLREQAAPGDQMRWINTIQDITEHKEQQRRVARLSRISAVLSGINSAIVRIHDRDELFQEACRVAVNQGGFSMAWIGVIDPATGNEQIVAWCGGEIDYIDKIKFTVDPGMPDNNRPVRMAVREMRPVICNDIGSELALDSLRTDLLAHGHRSAAALPLVMENRVVAVIALYTAEVGFFDEEELKLLNELAGDLSFGLQYIDKEEQLSYLAYYDALTGLPNSMLFHDRLTQFLHGNKQDQDIVAVIVINLHRFAQLNDALGRHAGDAVLKEVARRLGAALREPYSMARISGDTFAIAVAGLQQGADAAMILEQQILEPLSSPLTLDGQEIRIALHAGLALYPEDGSDAETLFKHAEVALKKARSSGERYLYYAPQMNAAIAARLALESELRIALDTRQFVMHYQPRVDLLSGRIVSAEALIRWQHPQRGLIPPAQFIPLAEETGLIVPIGAWVIDAVCAQQAAWLEQQVEIVPVAVNLSAVQFKKGAVLQTIRDAIELHGLTEKYIEFELTESVVMDNPDEAARDLQALKKLGMQLSLDDFGTGYSSLAYLKRFPFDFVKIDRTFITDLTNKPEDAAIATAIIAMAHSLGLRVVAEGVETEGQLRYLRQHRCDELQGYYFSPPVPAAAFVSMLQEDKQLMLTAEPSAQVRTLLIVDDEPHNLSAIRRLLRREGYRVLAASSGQEGLDLLALNAVQVIVSDQRMPGMSGSEFLGKVKELYPHTIRIILSGYTDLAAVTDSVNRGAVFKFLTKPWDDEELREHIRDAFRRYRPTT